MRKVKNIDRLTDTKFLVISGITLFGTLLILSLARHLSLGSSAFDLSIFGQAIWNAANGNGLYSSLMQTNLLGDHFEPILFFIVPLYKIWPSVNVLFILQSLLLSSAIIPLYLIARYNFKEKIIAFAFIVSYMLSRPLRGVALSDFHPECFILPLLFWAYYLLIKRKDSLFFMTVFLLLLCKEDVTFLISALGIFIYFIQKRKTLGAILFVSGILFWFLETKVFIPHFNTEGEYLYNNRLPFGAAYQGKTYTVLFNPGLLIGSFFTAPKILYCLKLFGPVGFFSFLSPAHYILIAVPLLKNLLPMDVNFSGWYNITSHYTAAVIPFIYIGAIYGVKWLVSRVKQQQTILFAVAFIVLSSLCFYGKTDASKFRRFLETIKQQHTLDRIAYLKSIPPRASVATNFNLLPHVSERRHIFVWNPLSETSYMAEYVVVDLKRLDYLGKDALLEVDPYLKTIQNSGYLKIFENKDNSFLIFYNQNFNPEFLS